ncbi:MAG: T9SS type A sorting domain-containing protein, partial [Flavobacterium sp.]
ILNGASQSDWSTVRSFTTISNPSLYSPSNVEIVNINPILQWYDVGGETGYIIQVDTVNTFDSSNLQSSTVGAFNGPGYPAAGTETLAFGTTYYWRVAILSGGSQSDWSTVRSFTTVSQPTLYSPVAGEVVNGVFVILQWYDYSGETGYVYQVDTVNTFDSSNLQTGNMGPHTSFGFPTAGVNGLDFGTTYYWRVAILSPLGQSGWSTVRSFSTVLHPNLIEPVNGSLYVGSTVFLKWSNTSGESGFAYQLDTDANFSSSNLQSGTVAAFENAIGDVVLGFNNLLPDTTYYWRIAFLAPTGQSQWSAVWKFATGGNLSVTDLENNQFVKVFPNPASDRIFISGTAGKATYQLNSTDGKLLQAGTVELGNSIDVSGLPNGVYFLQVTLGANNGVYKIVKK